MEKIAEYVILTGEARSGLPKDNLDSLMEKVNNYINEGWEPVGGVSPSRQYSEWEAEDYIQAMIRRYDPKDHF